MTQPSRPQARGPARRTRRRIAIEAVQPLEDRQLLTPFMTINDRSAVFNPTSTVTVDGVTTTTGTVDIVSTPSANSAAGFTTVAQLTSNAAFGGDIVRIEAGPGGDFGKGVYAISRGAGANADPNLRPSSLPAPINRPGVIYRVDPATGKSSIFFDLNTVLSQIDPGTPPGNGALPATGLLNWYDLTFDPEGYFDGKPSLFVSSVDTSDPLKNTIYRIGPAGEFLGLFTRFGISPTTGTFPVQPSAVYIPPVEQQSFLRGLFVGDANSDGGQPVLFFDANVFRPGQNVTGPGVGVTATPMTFGPQVGITSANAIYFSPIYDVFTDFGAPPAGGLPPAPGFSGVQGLRGDILIGSSLNPQPFAFADGFLNGIFYSTDPDAATPDTNGVISTPFRRFQDIAFDQYSYFSYGSTVTPGGFLTPTTIAPIPPLYSGSLFVADLASGLSVSLPAGDIGPIFVPVQGPGSATTVVDTNTDPDTLLDLQVNDFTLTGGRIVRIGPDGVVTPFAENFFVTPEKTAESFINSTLSISFSADGTTLYAADNEAIWQFKTVTSLAGSSSGSITGLNDLRSLGVPYQGQDLAVAVVDTGVDANNPLFRGRVAPGKNVVTNGFGSDDTAGVPNGHGTQMAGVIAQFVPQATIVPVNVFTPNQGAGTPVIGGTNSQIIWNGLQYTSQNPFVQDPVRPNTIARVMAAAFGFGTDTSFRTEGEAYRAYPQVVISFKNQFNRFRAAGIAPVVASGQFSTNIDNGGGTGAVGDTRGMALPAVINEVISVSGTFPFPFGTGPTADPTDPTVGPSPRPIGPVLVTDQTTGAIIGPNLIALTLPDLVIFKDKVLQGANRSLTTDFVAPALDIPTFSRTALGVTTVNVGGTGLMVFQEGGTSLSASIVTGSMALVASALNYWSTLADSGGVTADAYLNMPVGTRVLNFGPHAVPNLSAYQNPDSVYGILQWTAVPARDEPTTLDTVQADPLFPNAGGPFPKISRIDVGNAVAAIEGTVALYYLINHGTLDIIDANHNGLITAQEIQDFVDKADTIGLPEAGAMARLLGGTARIPVQGSQNTLAGESPEQPDVLQRRYNFFDYAADGQLDGVVSIDQFKMLVHTLLPSPDAFVVVDRQRASGNGYLLDPTKERNFVALQYTKPQFAFVPPSAVRRFRNISPSRFGVNRGLLPGDTTSGPQFTLYDRSRTARNGADGGAKGGGSGSGSGGGHLNGGGSKTGTGTTKPAAGDTTKDQPGTVAPPTTDGSTTPTTGDHGQQALSDFLKLINGSSALGATTVQGQSGSTGTGVGTILPPAQKSDAPGDPKPAGSSVSPVGADSTVSPAPAVVAPAGQAAGGSTAPDQPVSSDDAAPAADTKKSPPDQAAGLRDRANLLNAQGQPLRVDPPADTVLQRRRSLLARLRGRR